MRQVKKLSPTSLHLFERDREEFYLKYMSDAKPEWQPQSDRNCCTRRPLRNGWGRRGGS